jgi:hypothetical protein
MAGLAHEAGVGHARPTPATWVRWSVASGRAAINC